MLARAIAMRMRLQRQLQLALSLVHCRRAFDLHKPARSLLMLRCNIGGCDVSRRDVRKLSSASAGAGRAYGAPRWNEPHLNRLTEEISRLEHALAKSQPVDEQTSDVWPLFVNSSLGAPEGGSETPRGWGATPVFAQRVRRFGEASAAFGPNKALSVSSSRNVK